MSSRAGGGDWEDGERVCLVCGEGMGYLGRLTGLSRVCAACGARWVVYEDGYVEHLCGKSWRKVPAGRLLVMESRAG